MPLTPKKFTRIDNEIVYHSVNIDTEFVYHFSASQRTFGLGSKFCTGTVELANVGISILMLGQQRAGQLLVVTEDAFLLPSNTASFTVCMRWSDSSIPRGSVVVSRVMRKFDFGNWQKSITT